MARGLLSAVCAGYAPQDGGVVRDRDRDDGTAGLDLLSTFDDGVGWLFAYAGDALRDPSAPPPPTRVSVMVGFRLDVRVVDWVEVSECSTRGEAVDRIECLGLSPSTSAGACVRILSLLACPWSSGPLTAARLSMEDGSVTACKTRK